MGNDQNKPEMDHKIPLFNFLWGGLRLAFINKKSSNSDVKPFETASPPLYDKEKKAAIEAICNAAGVPLVPGAAKMLAPDTSTPPIIESFRQALVNTKILRSGDSYNFNWILTRSESYIKKEFFNARESGYSMHDGQLYVTEDKNLENIIPAYCNTANNKATDPKVLAKK